MYQSGLLDKCWDHAASYAVIALNVTKKAPILGWEKDPSRSSGIKEHAESKATWTCWQAHNGGKDFEGPTEPFGRLCYYLQLDPDHPMMPTTRPGLFLGWRIDFGVEFGGILRIGDYEWFRQGKFSMTRVRDSGSGSLLS